MSGRRSKELRKHTNDVKRGALEAVEPAINASLENERITRQRVDALETWAMKFSQATLWRRWRWLFTGL
jgi:hypothetical protein